MWELLFRYLPRRRKQNHQWQQLGTSFKNNICILHTSFFLLRIFFFIPLPLFPFLHLLFVPLLLKFGWHNTNDSGMVHNHPLRISKGYLFLFGWFTCLEFQKCFPFRGQYRCNQRGDFAPYSSATNLLGTNAHSFFSGFSAASCRTGGHLPADPRDSVRNVGSTALHGCKMG